MSKLSSLHLLKELDDTKDYLILINPNQIPHLVLLTKGNYFALTYKESILGKSFTSYFEALKRTSKKMILLELKTLQNDPIQIFNKYEQAGEKTCFVPIKETLLPTSSAEFIFELVPDLLAAGLIEESFHLNMEDDLDNLGDFKMMTYTLEDIYAYIESLKQRDAERRKSLS